MYWNVLKCIVLRGGMNVFDETHYLLSVCSLSITQKAWFCTIFNYSCTKLFMIVLLVWDMGLKLKQCVMPMFSAVNGKWKQGRNIRSYVESSQLTSMGILKTLVNARLPLETWKLCPQATKWTKYIIPHTFTDTKNTNNLRDLICQSAVASLASKRSSRCGVCDCCK